MIRASPLRLEARCQWQGSRTRRERRTHLANLLNISHFGDKPCSWHLPRVILVQALDIGEEEEVVGSAHSSCDRREGVVVAKLVDVEDLGHRDGVVLVDNRNDTETEQS